MNKRSIIGGIIGILATVCTVLIGTYNTLCTSIIDSFTAIPGDGSGTNYTVYVIAFGIVAAAIGMVGAAFSFKKAYIGGILQLVAAGFVVATGIAFAFHIWIIINISLFALGSACSFVLAK